MCIYKIKEDLVKYFSKTTFKGAVIKNTIVGYEKAL